MGKNIKIDIINDEQIFIDGATGERLTKEQFVRKHKKGFNLGQDRVNLSPSKEGEGVKEN